MTKSGKWSVDASRLAVFGEILEALNASCVDAPRRRWCLWRFASLIPSGCRLPPIHKVMGDHASRGTTAAGASAVTWFFRMSFPRYTAGESGFGEKVTPYFFTIIVFESHSFEKNAAFFVKISLISHKNCHFWATKCRFWDILCEKLKILFVLI